MNITVVCDHCGGPHFRWDCRSAPRLDCPPKRRITVAIPEPPSLAGILAELKKIRELLERA